MRSFFKAISYVLLNEINLLKENREEIPRQGDINNLRYLPLKNDIHLQYKPFRCLYVCYCNKIN